MKIKKIIIIIVSIIVFFVTLIFIYSQIYKMNSRKIAQKEEKNRNETGINQEKSDEEKFDNIFVNRINDKEYVSDAINKIVAQQPYVYTIIEKKEEIEGKYNINIKIPLININCETAQKFNNITQQIFVDKVNKIVEQEDNFTIYKTEYMSYINGSTLSLIIRATLKEANSSQRVIVQTYNLNLETLEEEKFINIIEDREMDKVNVQNCIKEKLTKKNEEATTLKELGYEVFNRDLSDTYYNINNIDNFFIDEENKINVIFAYGNQNFTSEIDVIKLD